MSAIANKGSRLREGDAGRPSYDCAVESASEGSTSELRTPSESPASGTLMHRCKTIPLRTFPKRCLGDKKNSKPENG